MQNNHIQNMTLARFFLEMNKNIPLVWQKKYKNFNIEDIQIITN